ncbi:MAG: hypothetical protein CL878_14025 [Dehalococcoidia bacterium]|nr:hypothetical protein [Dehalococcoidia bacterium]
MTGAANRASPQQAPTIDNALSPAASVDLHLHTLISDGRWTPEELTDAVGAAGVDVCAVTDHDSIEAIAPVTRRGSALGIRVVPGIEFTADFRGELLHLLAYNINPDHAQLSALLRDVQTREHQRAWGLVERMREQQIVQLSQEDVDQLATEPRLTQAKLVRLLQELGYHEPAEYRPLLLRVMEAPFCTTAVEAIAEALRPQGCPLIVAHPGSGMPEYAPVIESLTHESMLAMLELGLVDGLEVHHPRHTPEMRATYAEVASSRGVLVSAGSDSHDTRNPPRPHPASWCRELLTRVGITIA